jgi:hypothetical protein
MNVDTIPVPGGDPGGVGGIGVVVKDAAGLTYFLTPKIASSAAVTDAVMASKLQTLYQSAAAAQASAAAASAAEVQAYSMSLDSNTTKGYDAGLANLYNLWANIQLCLGAKVGTDNYKATYDVNGDNVIDEQDAAIVKQKIYEYK